MNKKYSIVCYLEGGVKEKVRKIQENLFEVAGSRKCLDSWDPHITLGSGIVVSDVEQNETYEKFKLLASGQEALDIKIFGFGGTREWPGAKDGILTPYVLWINVEVSERLQSLFDLIADTITSKYDTFYPRITKYTPHVTVAYGDLTKDGYEKGADFLKQISFTGEISISHIALVENFPDKDVEYKRFYFGKTKSM